MPEGEDSIESQNVYKLFCFYLSFKTRTCWYVWKSHTKQYKSYKEFKDLNSKLSISKQLKKDIKIAFKRK